MNYFPQATDGRTDGRTASQTSRTTTIGIFFRKKEKTTKNTGMNSVC